MDRTIESLASYASDERIISLVAKERGKAAAKCRKSARRLHDEGIFSQVQSLTPPHSKWIHPGKGRMPGKGEHGLAAWTSGKKRASARVLASIKWGREHTPDAPWAVSLDAFIRDVRDTLSGDGTITLETPQTHSKFKKAVSESGPFIYRPICSYSDLKTKVILSLSCGWLLSFADQFFGPHMLFMRKAARQDDGSWKVPNYMDAIDRIDAYRKTHDRESIWVGECDIQKFYDIFNHDDIVLCFEELFSEVREATGAPDETFIPFRRVLDAYLASYDFPSQVLGKNGDRTFWARETAARRTKDVPEPECLFQWVDEDGFISSGCYTPEEFAAARAGGKLGIPQGGALSGLIVNVVMHSIDRKILSREDPGRLMIRYCDDIILMITDPERCREDLDAYRNELTRHRLLYHPFRELGDLKRGKRNRNAFWNAKSKGPYLWGPAAETHRTGSHSSATRCTGADRSASARTRPTRS